jgi:L-asparaginase
VQKEGSDLAVYNTGNSLKHNPGILEAYDMTTEAAVAKIMWILAQTRDIEKIRRMFYTAVNSDILTKRR